MGMKFEIFLLTFLRMHIRTLTPLLVTICLAGFAACGTNEEAVPESLSATYADLLAYRHASASLDSTSYARGIDSILTVHGYDRSSFAAAFDKLGTSADEVNEFFGSVSTQLIPSKQPKQRPE